MPNDNPDPNQSEKEISAHFERIKTETKDANTHLDEPNSIDLNIDADPGQLPHAQGVWLATSSAEG